MHRVTRAATWMRPAPRRVIMDGVRFETAIEEEAVHPEASGPDAADVLIDTAASAMAAGGTDLLHVVLEHAPVGIALLDPQLRPQYANAAFVQRLGAHHQPTGAAAEALRQVLADGRSRVLPAEGPLGPAAQARRLEVNGQLVGVILALSAATAAAEQHDLEQARARLALLDAAATRIGTTLDIDTTCAELAHFAVPQLADLATVDVLPPEAADRGSGAAAGLPRLRRAAVACAEPLRSRVETLALPGETVRHRAGSAAARCLETGKPVIVDLFGDAEAVRTAIGPVALTAYRSAGIDTLLTVPLTARDQVIGVMALGRARGSARRFTDDDVVLVEDLAGRAAISIDNARRYTRSQGIALELQRALLAEPGNPHPNLELASRYLPSGTSSVVGGDWYETVRLPFGRTLLVMGDVMGHGVEAAVDMSSYRSMLRYVAAMDLPPHRILRQLDTLISENESSRPATCLLALADPPRARWTLSSAGHLPPALISTDRPNELIDVPTGPPLGTGLGGYEQTTRELRPEQVLLLYTDGLVERRGEDIDVSLARLAALPLPATGDLDELLDAALHGLTPHAAEDDIALLAARIRPR